MRLQMILVPILLVTMAAAVSLPVCLDTAWGGSAMISEIRIQKSVLVRQKEVCLADICDPETLTGEWKTIAEGLNIGDAPPAGSEKFIDPAQLRAYLVKLIESKGLDASDVKLDIPDKIVVRRESTQITHEQIESIFKKYVAENSQWKPQNVTVQRVQFTGLPIIPAGQMSYEVIPTTPKQRFIGNVNANIEFYVNGEKARTLGVTGKVEVFENVYLASRPIRRNEIITPADIEVQRTNITDSADRFATRPDQVETRRVLRDIGVHQPIELKDLDKPLVLKKGDPVTIVYDQPGLQVTAKGRVNADGGIGDTLAVVNVASKKTIHCKVVDGQTVRTVR
ncbi:MAG: flagellar basal body P-ring formation chaperone FlgA [Syntrophobacter sp.]